MSYIVTFVFLSLVLRLLVLAPWNVFKVAEKLTKLGSILIKMIFNWYAID
jgi:hypothetical protein